MSVLKKNKSPKFRTAPTCEEEFRKLADELIQWGNRPETLTMNSFPLHIMMSPQAFHKLPADSEYFSQAYDIALHTIGSRREKLAQEGILDKQMVLQTMPLYDQNYRQWLIRLKDKSDNKSDTKIVVVEIPALTSDNQNL